MTAVISQKDRTFLRTKRFFLFHTFRFVAQEKSVIGILALSQPRGYFITSVLYWGCCNMCVHSCGQLCKWAMLIASGDIFMIRAQSYSEAKCGAVCMCELSSQTQPWLTHAAVYDLHIQVNHRSILIVIGHLSSVHLEFEGFIILQWNYDLLAHLSGTRCFCVMQHRHSCVKMQMIAVLMITAMPST